MNIILDLLTTDNKYGHSFNTSLIVSSLLYCVFVMTKIKYGTVLITKMTLDPYRIASYYMLNLLVQSLVYMSKDLISSKQGKAEELPAIWNILGNLTYTLKIALLLTFIIY